MKKRAGGPLSGGFGTLKLAQKRPLDAMREVRLWARPRALAGLANPCRAARPVCVLRYIPIPALSLLTARRWTGSEAEDISARAAGCSLFSLMNHEAQSYYTRTN